MVIRSPVTTKKRQLEEAIELTRKEGLVTSLEDLDKLGSDEFKPIPGRNNGGVREEFHIFEMEPDACKAIRGTPIGGGRECLLRAYKTIGDDDTIKLKKPDLVD